MYFVRASTLQMERLWAVELAEVTKPYLLEQLMHKLPDEGSSASKKMLCQISRFAYTRLFLTARSQDIRR